MFTKYYDKLSDVYNNIGIIEKKTDKFTKEVSVNTYHIKYDYEEEFGWLHGWDDYYRDENKSFNLQFNKWEHHRCLLLPESKCEIDVQYHSSPDGEEYGLSYASYDPSSTMNLIINLNDCDNITLKNPVYSQMGYRWRHYYKIDKSDFIRCCEAQKISIQVRNGQDIYDEKEDCKELLLSCQAIYNVTIDDTKYQDAQEKLKTQIQEKLNEFRTWKEQEDKKKEQKKAEEEKKRMGQVFLGVIIIVIIIIGMNYFLTSGLDRIATM